MAIKSMTSDQFIAFLKQKQGDDTAKDFAAKLKVSPQYLSDVYNLRREPGEAITDALGVQRETRYVVDVAQKENK
jgi:predicted transcriptional regulator